MTTITHPRWGELLIDDEDAEFVSGLSLSIISNQYWAVTRKATNAVACLKRGIFLDRVEYLHRILMPGCKRVDHKDGNNNNLQKANLRCASPQQNMWNRPMKRASSSGYKGVFYYGTKRNKHRPWSARSTIMGRFIYLGYYSSPELAALAYDAYARLTFGEFARFNFPLIGERGLDGEIRVA